MVIYPSAFEIICDLLILFFILRYMIMEEINYHRKNKQKFKKQNLDIKYRLEKANKEFYKKFKK